MKSGVKLYSPGSDMALGHVLVSVTCWVKSRAGFSHVLG